MGGNSPGGNFPGGISPDGNLVGESLPGGNSSVGNFPDTGVYNLKGKRNPSYLISLKRITCKNNSMNKIFINRPFRKIRWKRDKICINVFAFEARIETTRSSFHILKVRLSPFILSENLCFWSKLHFAAF